LGARYGRDAATREARARRAGGGEGEAGGRDDATGGLSKRVARGEVVTTRARDGAREKGDN